jgi:hypothetical protein
MTFAGPAAAFPLAILAAGLLAPVRQTNIRLLEFNDPEGFSHPERGAPKH